MPEILTYADQGFNFPILSLIVFLPLAGGIFMVLFMRSDQSIRQFLAILRLIRPSS